MINQSGIIFGGNSQVNVGSLIASTAGIDENQFLNNGIYGAQTGTTYAPSFTAAGGKVGALIPSMTDVKLPGGTAIELRPTTGGRQGANWAIAPMLPAGASSWDMQFTAGADLGSADVRARNAKKTGNIVLADTHYASRGLPGATSLNLSEIGAQALIDGLGPDGAGFSLADFIGKSESEILQTLFGEPGHAWSELADYYPQLNAAFWNVSSGHIELGLNQQGLDLIMFNLGGFLPPGITDPSELLFKTKAQLYALYSLDPMYSWEDGFGVPNNFLEYGSGYSQAIVLPPTNRFSSPSFSVVRTGTGNLSLSAAGNIRMDSLYGVYTAGTATQVSADYTRPRGKLENGTLLGTPELDTAFDPATAVYKAWYPDQGGNVTIAAGGNLIGDIYGQSRRQTPSSVTTANWLWRQGTGTTQGVDPVPTAWWINFGTYVASVESADNPARLPDITGFTGIGALGGGNVAIRVEGEAGAITLRGNQGDALIGAERSQGLVVAVGSTGRVGSDGALTLTGGGDIDMRIAGALNPNLALTTNTERHALPGALINLRGNVQLNAESVGGVKLIYGLGRDAFDPRGADPFAATRSEARSGFTLVPGDATMTVQTRGDLVLGGAGDAGRSYLLNSGSFTAGGVSYDGGSETWFSLWTRHTAINLISAGGNLTPTTSVSEDAQLNSNQSFADSTIVYPSILRAAALSGSIYYGANALPYMGNGAVDTHAFVTLAPSPYATLEMLAGHSIYGGQYGISVSGTGTPMPTPFNPAFMSREIVFVGPDGRAKFTNGSFTGTISPTGNLVPGSLFVFGPKSAAVPLVRAADADPIRFYAGTGDIVGLYTGETVTNGLTRYNGSGPLMVRAGRDIAGAGLAPGATQTSYGGGNTRGNLIVHGDVDDVSIVSAGRDIVYANFDIAGPGQLEVSAGRNIYQADRGGISSLGPIVPGDKRAGAGVAMLAGVGAAGPDYERFAALYLDPSKLASTGTPLADQPGRVAKTYEKELAAWLKERFGFAGPDGEARSYFATLAPEQRHIFLRTIYFAELTAGGREYNEEGGPRFGSYLRGRNAIATLFPAAPSYGGDITMFGPSGIRTVGGGDVQLLAPGGRTVIGVEGKVPTGTPGLITQGGGNIQLYAQGSILLGLSRIMTTFGGNIMAWSAEGDINAGRGAKTSSVYTPPKRITDKYGLIELSSDTPSSGAGIATLNPVPEVPAGDIDLIAPLGTIDAGEAGIRVSGNVNLAALQILNAANIQVQGTSSGIPTVQAPSISAALSTSNATAASQQTATPNQGAGNTQPSVIIVEVLGYGGGSSDHDERRSNRSDTSRRQSSYDPADSVRVLGNGQFTREQIRDLTDEERSKLSDASGNGSLR